MYWVRNMQVDVKLRNLPGTEAAVGWAGGHTIVADRPQGKAGGQGLGFNGAQLLALSLGGCFCNDLRYVAEEMGVGIADISVDVSLELAGAPLVAVAAHMTVHCTTDDGSDAQAIVDRAKASCMVSNSLTRGVPVDISLAG